MYSHLKVTYILICQPQVPIGNYLSASIANLVIDGQLLLAELDGLAGIAHAGVGIAQVAQIVYFAHEVPDLAIADPCRLLALWPPLLNH